MGPALVACAFAARAGLPDICVRTPWDQSGPRTRPRTRNISRYFYLTRRDNMALTDDLVTMTKLPFGCLRMETGADEGRRSQPGRGGESGWRRTVRDRLRSRLKSHPS